MEHLLQLVLGIVFSLTFLCFNPYFYGTSTSTELCRSLSSMQTGFNPYFYGTSTSTLLLSSALRLIS